MPRKQSTPRKIKIETVLYRLGTGFIGEIKSDYFDVIEYIPLGNKKDKNGEYLLFEIRAWKNTKLRRDIIDRRGVRR